MSNRCLCDCHGIGDTQHCAGCAGYRPPHCTLPSHADLEQRLAEKQNIISGLESYRAVQANNLASAEQRAREMREIIRACHVAVGEHEDSDDATLPKAISVLLEAYRERAREVAGEMRERGLPGGDLWRWADCLSPEPPKMRYWLKENAMPGPELKAWRECPGPGWIEMVTLPQPDETK